MSRSRFIGYPLTLFLILAVTSLPGGIAQAAPVTVDVGVQFTDTTGEFVHAHGGGVLQVGSYYYWFGENRHADDDTFFAVSAYRSTDLKTWEFRGHVLTQSSAAELESAKVERPKVIYNSSTGQFVMWMHKESGVHYDEARAAVAVSSTVDGSYTYLGSFRPLGHMSRDITAYVDDTGTAYMISAANDNKDLHVYRLSSDYTTVEQLVHVLWPGERRESPAMFKRDGVYFLLTSGQDGWLPTQQKYGTASCVECAWSAVSNVGDAKMYGSQTAYVLTIQGTQDTSYLYMGDRWGGSWGGPTNDSRYVWLPLQFPTSTSMTISYARELTIDIAAGTVTPIGTGYDRITVRHSGKCVQANQSAVVQYDCTGGTNQQWRLDSISNGNHRIVDRASSKCIDLSTGLIMWVCGVSKPKQHWTLRDLGTGYFELVNAVTGECAEVRGGETRNNVQLRPAMCTGTTNQQFQRTAL